MIRVSLLPGTQEILDMVAQYDKRIKALQSYLTYVAAESVYMDLISKIPSSKEYEEYRKSITVSKITGVKDGAGYVVYSKAKKGRLSKLDPSTTFIYVTAKTKRLTRLSTEIPLLERMNPWTFNTIPFLPDSRQADLVYRKVSEAEVTRREQILNRRLPRLRPQLARQGVKVFKTSKERAKISRKTQIASGSSVKGMELEFGITGSSRPHWKPAIMKFTKATLPSIPVNDPNIVDLFTKSGFKKWGKWSKLGSGSFASSDMKQFDGFLKRLAIKI